MTRFLLAASLVLLGVLTLAVGAWSALALFYAGSQHDALRIALASAAAIAALATLAALPAPRWRWRALSAYALLFALVLAWWSRIEPSNDRAWQTDVAVLPHATIEGDLVTVHNIRNFTYRSETDYTPAYYDKRFDLRKLAAIDLIAVYWMGPSIAHIFLSFAFADGEHLAISIETRKERSEGYSTIKGFFRQYELFYVVADERDVIGLRTNYRQDPPEAVYVYRLQGSIENARRLFMDYMTKINALQTQPEFYNTLTTNCTTNIWFHSRINPGHLPFHWKILASGHVPEYLYENERLDSSIPFDELRRQAYVNDRARAAGSSPDFSRLIREVSDRSAVGPAAH